MLLHNKHEYSNGKKYDPHSFINPTRGNVIKHAKARVNESKPAVIMELMIEIANNGIALAPKEKTTALRSAARRHNVRWYFKEYDAETVRIIPAPE